MTKTLRQLSLGRALSAPERAQLLAWMKGNTTGGERIRKAVPDTWLIADKTGTGDYGTTIDVALLLPPEREALVLSIYYTQDAQDAPPRDEVIVEATRIVLGIEEGETA